MFLCSFVKFCFNKNVCYYYLNCFICFGALFMAHPVYSNLLRATCLAHLMHNCALKLKSFCKEVDDLIAAVKASVVRNKSRAVDFDVYGRPPQPVVTCWGSSLDAANYYAEKLPQVQEIFNLWNGEGVIVPKVKNIVNEQKLTRQLAEISQCHNGLRNLIFKMENFTYTIQKIYGDINSLGLEVTLCG